MFCSKKPVWNLLLLKLVTQKNTRKSSMKKLHHLAFLVLLFCFSAAHSQQLSRDFWHDGEVTLFSGETLRGRLHYDLDNDNIQLQYAGAIKSFSAFQVESFDFFDEVLKMQRSFYALPYSKIGSYATPTFFELFADGYLTLLNREVITYRTATPMGFWGWGYRPFMGASIPVMDDSYYVLLVKEEKVIQITSVQKEVLALMEDKASEVEGFINANRIRLDRRGDLIRLFDFYNSFKPKNN